MLILGAFLLVAIGLTHSYLGEKYILIPLFKRNNLPKLLGGDEFTKQILRFAWHLTTIAWLGFAAILCLLSKSFTDIGFQIRVVIFIVFVLSALLSLIHSRGKHLSWLVFFCIAGLSLYG